MSCPSRILLAHQKMGGMIFEGALLRDAGCACAHCGYQRCSGGCFQLPFPLSRCCPANKASLALQKQPLVLLKEGEMQFHY